MANSKGVEHMNIKNVSIIGATGQVGTPLTKGLLKKGHRVTILTRGRNQYNDAKLAGHEKLGAMVVICPEMQNVDAVANALNGSDTLIASVPGSKAIIQESEPIWLKAAVKAGVERFVPTEFGCHTLALEMGDGEIFDHKKRFHKLLFASGIGWTLYYNGGFFDYFLPNLRFFRKITTFGNLELPIYTHDIEDIGHIGALAVTDHRTLNKCVQVDYNVLTQNEMLALLKKYWPDYPFEYEHFSSEYIIKMKEQGGNEVTAKKGAETDKERWGINYVIYVIGKLAAFTEQTLRATELFPDYVCKRPEEALSDSKFVFEE
jgi:uncharacterized protein YbjT (DUF2867 family)